MISDVVKDHSNYQGKAMNAGCFFQAVVLEGKYWKRRLDTVTATYKKWRKYFKDRLTHEHDSVMIKVW